MSRQETGETSQRESQKAPRREGVATMAVKTQVMVKSTWVTMLNKHYILDDQVK